MNEENLRIFWYNEPKTEWRIVDTSQVRKDEKRLWAQVPHFTIFRIMEYVAGVEELIEKEKVYVYPNPALGDKLYFKFYLGNKADVYIDVYNVAGELITHLQKTDNPAGIVSEIEWDISSIFNSAEISAVRIHPNAGTTLATFLKLPIGAGGNESIRCICCYFRRCFVYLFESCWTFSAEF